MTNRKATSYEEFEAELLQDAEIRKEYEALKPKYDMIQSLIERRNQLRMTQTRLARIIGTKQPAISRLESGDFNIRIGTFLKVIHALDLNLQVLPKTRKQRGKVLVDG